MVTNPSDVERHRLPGVLTARELVMLQLRARGYSQGRIAALIGLSIEEMAKLERSASTALGAGDIHEAVAIGRRRRLIL